MFSGIHTLFFALRPDPATYPDITRIVDDVKAKPMRGSWLKPTNYHITLHYLESYRTIPPVAIDHAKNIAAVVRSAPLEIVLDRVMSFRRNRNSPCVLLASDASKEAMLSLWEDLRVPLWETEFRKNIKSDFTPHLTIGYTNGMLDKTLLETPIKWYANEFLLIDSHFGAGKHEPLGHWHLFGSADSINKPNLAGTNGELEL